MEYMGRLYFRDLISFLTLIPCHQQLYTHESINSRLWIEEISNSQGITILISLSSWDESTVILKHWGWVLIESSYGESKVRVRFLNQKLCLLRKRIPKGIFLKQSMSLKYFSKSWLGWKQKIVATRNSIQNLILECFAAKELLSSWNTNLLKLFI